MILEELINAKHEHLNRLANQHGSFGEDLIISRAENWFPRPKGDELKTLLSVLQETGIVIKRSSFDAISIPLGKTIDYSDTESLRKLLPQMIFIEIKTANQDRVKPDFSGFFFALTENEILAAQVLGARHKVVLYNRISNEILVTSIPEIIDRAKSTTWQLSVQL